MIYMVVFIAIAVAATLLLFRKKTVQKGVGAWTNNNEEAKDNTGSGLKDFKKTNGK